MKTSITNSNFEIKYLNKECYLKQVGENMFIYLN